LKFTIDSEKLEKALTKVQMKGKGISGSGFGNTSLGNYASLYLEGNVLSIWNGNNTVAVKLNLTVEGEEDGNVVIDTTKVSPYLKSFKDEIEFVVGDFIQLTTDTRKASIPLVVRHPQGDSISRMRGLLNHVSYEVMPRMLFTFGKSKFEACISLMQVPLRDAIKNCELVKTGVYKFNYHEEILSVSSRDGASNKYEETIEPFFNIGESATVEFSGPLYALFEKQQMVNIYLKDDFPILMVAEDRMLVKAPQING
tara:strand:- start:8444 stop:9208 length:765 start_codon:yes stop_codon:yes gene_type:complete